MTPAERHVAGSAGRRLFAVRAQISEALRRISMLSPETLAELGMEHDAAKLRTLSDELFGVCHRLGFVPGGRR